MIKDKLQALSDLSSAAGYHEDAADAQAVCEFAENVRDSILEYQVSTDLKGFIRSWALAEVPHSLFNRKHYTSKIVN